MRALRRPAHSYRETSLRWMAGASGPPRSPLASDDGRKGCSNTRPLEPEALLPGINTESSRTVPPLFVVIASLQMRIVKSLPAVGGFVEKLEDVKPIGCAHLT
jgi:hypothetical protein